MNRSAQVLAAALWGATVFAAVYLLQGALHLPALAYDPAGHHWVVTSSLTGVQMRYYSDREKNSRTVNDVLVQFLGFRQGQARRPYSIRIISHSGNSLLNETQVILPCGTRTRVVLGCQSPQNGGI